MKKEIINLTNELISIGKERSILHLTTEDGCYNGRTIELNQQDVLNFGSYSYLGLEIDERLKQGAIDAISRYGIQYPSSRAYMSCSLYREMEDLLAFMFQKPILVATTTTLGHQAVVPVVVEENDVIILDQQVHASVQDVAYKVQQKGVTLEIVRHNDLEALEEKVKFYSQGKGKIWFMIDGVYSMYGDCPKLKETLKLVDAYEQLYLYVDDAHGMSWAGKNGTGYVLSEIDFHDKMILATSMNKAFAAGGGLFVFPDSKMRDKVKNCGGPLIFAGQHQMSAIGASIESTKIHLSEEIYTLQQDLNDRIAYCETLLQQAKLPVISDPNTPIFFIGVGLAKVGYNLVERLIRNGFYANLSIFPAVPESCTGLRFSLTNHLNFEDIEQFVDLIAEEYPKALLEENRTEKDVFRAFRRILQPKNFVPQTYGSPVENTLKISVYDSIADVPAFEWNKQFKDAGVFDTQYLAHVESIFSNQERKEHNWKPHYIIIKDQLDTPVLSTFVSQVTVKDDMLSSVSISEQVEIERILDPYYLTSQVLMMGFPITEGEHCQINRSHPMWKKALEALLDQLWKIQDEFNLDGLFLRDFDAEDMEVRNVFFENGFLKSVLPSTSALEVTWNSEEDYQHLLGKKKRKELRRNVLSKAHLVKGEIVESADPHRLEQWYTLYQNVKRNNLALNDFGMPETLFEHFIAHPSCETIEFTCTKTEQVIGVVFCNKSEHIYSPMLLGMDYKYIPSHNLYKQILYKLTCRAKELGVKQIHFGLTAAEVKKKFGAKEQAIVAYAQFKDKHNQSVLNLMGEQKRAMVKSSS